MNPPVFGDPVTFPQTPLSGQSFYLNCDISQSSVHIIPGPQNMCSKDFADPLTFPIAPPHLLFCSFVKYYCSTRSKQACSERAKSLACLLAAFSGTAHTKKKSHSTLRFFGSSSIHPPPKLLYGYSR